MGDKELALELLASRGTAADGDSGSTVEDELVLRDREAGCQLSCFGLEYGLELVIVIVSTLVLLGLGIQGDLELSLVLNHPSIIVHLITKLGVFLVSTEGAAAFGGVHVHKRPGG